jgi:hypothetical protein
MSSTTTTPNVTLDFSKSQPVQGDSVTLDFSKAQPTAVSMVGPQGEKQQVSPENVAAMRQKNFAVTPDTPGAAKMVSPQGQVNYALPSEVQNFQKSGHTLIRPDGSFDLQNIPGEDPLKEAERYQLVRKALTAQEKAGANKAEIKNTLKAGAGAAVATAAGVTGAGPLASGIEAAIAPSVVPVAGGAGFGGAGASTVAGPSAISGAATWAARQLVMHGTKLALGSVGGTALVTKLMHLW